MPDSRGITILAGVKSVTNEPVVPFDELSCQFIEALSRSLSANDVAKTMPDVLSFSFWCRRKNIDRFRESYSALEHRLGVGIVFHIAPGNVPVSFAFSLVFGLLAGNANIVKVPTGNFPQIDIICGIIRHLFGKNEFARIRYTTSIVSYDHRSDLTDNYSQVCNARIVWGGDNTIEEIRKSAIPIRSREINFSDRYSFSVIDLNALELSSSMETGRLAERFYTDAYLLDQRGCSSPHFVIWLGKDKGNNIIKDKFWSAVSVIARDRYELTEDKSTDKFIRVCQNALELENVAHLSKQDMYVCRISLSSPVESMDTLRGQFGYFYEYETEQLENLIPMVNERAQTLSYYGIEPELLKDFVLRNSLLGVDRIVPIGQAFQMNKLYWDGYDTLRTLSRVIDVS